MSEKTFEIAPEVRERVAMQPRIQIPAGCEVEKIETTNGAVVVTFKESKPKLPKSWEEFRKMFPKITKPEFYIGEYSGITITLVGRDRMKYDKNLLPDRATAEAVLALCQLIQLRNCYNGDWVPDWTDGERKYTIEFYEYEIWCGDVCNTPSILYFKSKELRDEFLRNFRPLIEKSKPLYGIKEGGEK